MTEQEAEAWAARLVRIWAPNAPSEQWAINFGPDELRLKVNLDESDVFVAQIGPSFGAAFQIRRKDMRSDVAFLMYFTKSGHIKRYAPAPYPEEFAQLIAKYLPFFRRGCWLCGLPIEATAHEKVEWIQGFSREEVEAWNLKM